MSFIFYDKAKSSVLPAFGLANRGASCWLNSLLQMLFSMPALIVIIIEIINGSTRNKFAKLLHKLSQNQNGDALGEIHNYLILNYGAITPSGLQSQECVAEGLTFIIDALKHPNIKKLFTNVYQMSFNCPSCKQTVSVTRDIVYTINLFDSKSSPVINTVELFQEYVTNRISEVDAYRCDNCNAILRNVKRVERLRQVHDIIIFTFDKFFEKSSTWFPASFSVPYCRDNARGRLYYRLVSRIVHSGTKEGGHYHAHCLRKTADSVDWFDLNDSSVSAGSCSPSNDTFIAAYHVDRLELHV